jgi:diguanylate cyclase (GGDEF)-like protein
MKILIVEDDWQCCHLLKTALSEQRYLVSTAADGQTGWELAQAGSYDLILLDVMLPKLDGISFCRQLRASGQQTPILLMTAQDQSRDKALGLDAGADDYLVKPIALEELEARIRALLRRQTASRSPLLEWGDLCLDPKSCKVTYAGAPLNLTAKEYGLLELFLRNSQRIFSQSAILDRLWTNDLPSEDTVRAHIKRLRQKLRLVGAADLIETVYGLGYRLNAASRLPVAPVLPVDIPPVAQPTRLPKAWEQHQPQLLSRIDRLERLVRVASAQPQPEVWAQMQRDCHQLIGTLGILGLSEAIAILRQIENLLRLQRFDQALLVQVARLNLEVSARKKPELPRLLLVSQDAEFVSQLERAAADRAVIYGVPQLNDAVVTRLNPDLIWLDLSADAATTLNWLRPDQPPAIPIGVIAAAQQPIDRLWLGRCQVRRILHQPVPPNRILEITQQILERSQYAESKILLVDDDPLVLHLLQRLLATWGLDAVTLNPADGTRPNWPTSNWPTSNWPELFWQHLAFSPPDLLILDVQMPDLDGITLCRQLRESTWAWLPVLFLTGSTDAETMQQIFAARADDYVTKPIVAPELITRIFNRLDRTRLLRQQSEIDRLTHLPNRARSSQDLTALLLQAEQDQQPFCLMVLEFAGLKRLNYQAGHAAGDQILQQMAQILKQAFRPADVVARWGMAFVVGLSDLTSADGATWLTQILAAAPAQIEIQRLGLSVGLAQYPDDGTDLETLVRVAGLAALAQA